MRAQLLREPLVVPIGRKLRVQVQEGLDLLLILLRQQRAGGVHQQSPGPHAIRAGIEDVPLDRYQRFDGLALQAVLDVRLVAHHAQTRAGRIHQHRVHGQLHALHGLCSVAHLCADVVQLQTARRRADQLHAMLVQIPGVHAARALHRLGDQAGLAPGRGAGVQHLHARLRAHRSRRQHGALPLNGEQALAVALVGGELARTADPVGPGHGGMLPGKAVLGQPRLERRVAHAHAVCSDGVAAAIRRPGENLLGLVNAVGRNKPRNQLRRSGILFRQIGFRLRVAIGQGHLARIPVADQAPQHAVHQRGKSLPTRAAGLLHGLVHRRVIRNLVHEQDLRRGDAEDVHDLRLRARLQARGKHVLDAQPVLQREVEHAGGQAAILVAEMRRAQLPIQCLRRIRVVARHIAQRPQRHVPCGRPRRLRRSRSAVAALELPSDEFVPRLALELLFAGFAVIFLLERPVAGFPLKFLFKRLAVTLEIPPVSALIPVVSLIHSAVAPFQLNLVPISIRLPCR